MVSDQHLLVRTTVVSSLNPCSNGIWSLTQVPSSLSTPFSVLILVLMEYGLWQTEFRRLVSMGKVLILVLMEYGLWQVVECLLDGRHGVLILVLMEYGLWLNWEGAAWWPPLCLNPCSNGIWSLTWLQSYGRRGLRRLNPCSNGIWSLTEMSSLLRTLVFCLNPCSNGIWSLTPLSSRWGWGGLVLILVLMEYGLWLAEDWCLVRQRSRS